jgi:hypothetical protein
MLHACVERFDVMDGIGNILGWDEEVNKANVEIQFPMAKRSIPDAVLTLICFITPARAVSSLLNSLVVSTSSTITMSSLRF